MKLLYELPELPAGAWHATLHPGRDHEPTPWLDTQLARAGSPARRRAAGPVETAGGWPADILSFEIGGSFGVPPTFVVAIAYRFVDLVAAIVIGGLQAPWLAEHEMELVAALRGVEPDWVADEPVAITDLFT